jgi:hypothetical protein
MNNVVIRSLIKDGVEVTFCEGIFFIAIDGVIEIEAKRNEDKTWSLFDKKESGCINFDSFEDVWEHIDDLVTIYNLFSAEWTAENYEMLRCLFKGG